MKKVLEQISISKLPAPLLIFIAVFAISIFGLQVSKIYAQESHLSRDLKVGEGADVLGNMRVYGGLRVGDPLLAAPSAGLIVHGGANFSDVVYANTSSQGSALATVEYVSGAIDNLPECPPCPECDSCCDSGGGTSPPAGTDCVIVQDFAAPCDGPMPFLSLGRECPPSSPRPDSYIPTSCSGSYGYWSYWCCPL